MSALKQPAAAARRRTAWMLRVGLGLAAAWLAFVVFLDVQHALFPKTTIGGLKILAAAALLFAVVGCAGLLAARLLRRIGGRRKGS